MSNDQAPTYKVIVLCTNCRNDTLAELPKGTLIAEERRTCEYCGCHTGVNFAALPHD